VTSPTGRGWLDRGERSPAARAPAQRKSSGAVEGNVTRVKRLKRDGYGRAKFDVGSVAGSGIAWRIRPQRPLLVYVVLYFLEIPVRLAWALLAPLPVLAVSAGMAGLSFAAASSLWQTVLATRIASRQFGTVAAADEASGALANPLAIALTAPLIAALGARTIMAGGLLWLVVSTTALTALTAIGDPMASGDQSADAADVNS
jgi:hypothetical protein